LRQAALALGFLVLASAPAAADGIAFRAGQADELAIVAAAFPDAVAADGMQVTTARIDLNGDGFAEIAAQFRSPQTCGNRMGRLAQCRTDILAHDGTAWRTVLERNADRISVGAARDGGMRDIVIDGKEAWSWTDAGYRPDPSALGVEVAFVDAPKDKADGLVRAFDDGAAMLAAGAVLRYAAADVVAGGEMETVVRLDPPGGCAGGLCEVRVLQESNGIFIPVLAGETTGKVVVTGVERLGFRDVALTTPDGYQVMGWNGSAYAQSEAVDEGEIQ
jgi:hypothetical protein